MFSRAYYEWLHGCFTFHSQNQAQSQQYLNLLNYIDDSIDADKTPEQIKNCFTIGHYLLNVKDTKLHSKMESWFETLYDLEMMGVREKDFLDFYLFVKEGIRRKIAFVHHKVDEASDSYSQVFIKNQLENMAHKIKNNEPWILDDRLKKFKHAFDLLSKALRSFETGSYKFFGSILEKKLSLLDKSVSELHLEDVLQELHSELSFEMLASKKALLEKNPGKRYSNYPILWMKDIHDKLKKEQNDTELLAYDIIVDRLAGNSVSDIEVMIYPEEIFVESRDEESKSSSSSEEKEDTTSGFSVEALLEERSPSSLSLSTLVAGHSGGEGELGTFLRCKVIKQAVLDQQLSLGYIAQCPDEYLELWNDYFDEIEPGLGDDAINYQFILRLFYHGAFELLNLACNEKYGKVPVFVSDEHGNTLWHSFFMNVENFNSFSYIEKQQMQCLLETGLSLAITNKNGDTPLIMFLRQRSMIEPFVADHLAGVFEVISRYQPKFMSNKSDNAARMLSNFSEKFSLLGYLLSRKSKIAHEVNLIHNIFNTTDLYHFDGLSEEKESADRFALRQGNDELAALLLDGTTYPLSSYSQTDLGKKELLKYAIDNKCPLSESILASRMTKSDLDSLIPCNKPLMMSIRDFPTSGKKLLPIPTIRSIACTASGVPIDSSYETPPKKRRLDL